MGNISGKIYRTSGEIEDIILDMKVSNLKKLQEIVGGYIELSQYGGKVFIVNEEGYILDLPYNHLIDKEFNLSFVGNVVVFPEEFLEDF